MGQRYGANAHPRWQGYLAHAASGVVPVIAGIYRRLAHGYGFGQFVGARLLHGVVAGGVLDADAHAPQPVGHLRGQDEDELLGLVDGDVFQGNEDGGGGLLHGSEGDAHGGIVAHHLNVASGQGILPMPYSFY